MARIGGEDLSHPMKGLTAVDTAVWMRDVLVGKEIEIGDDKISRRGGRWDRFFSATDIVGEITEVSASSGSGKPMC